MAYNIFIFILFYSIAVVPCIGMYNKALNNISTYRMAKLHCHINHCDATVQYFAILHAHKYCTISRKSRRLKIRYTLTFIRKNKRPVRCDIVCGKKFLSRDMCRLTRDKIVVQWDKKLSHPIKQLLHQYHKILAFCNIKGELASSSP